MENNSHQHCKRCGQKPAKNSEYCLSCLQKRERFKNIEYVGLIIGIISLFAWLKPIIGMPIALIGLVFSFSGYLNNHKFAKIAMGMNFAGLSGCTIHLIVMYAFGGVSPFLLR